MFLQNKKVQSLAMRESFFMRNVSLWNSIKSENQELRYERFKKFAHNFVVSIYRAETLPNNSAAF